MKRMKKGMTSTLVIVLAGFFMVVAVSLVGYVNQRSNNNDAYINAVKAKYMAKGALEQVAFEISRQVHHPGLAVPTTSVVGMDVADWDIGGDTSNKTVTVTAGELVFVSNGPGQINSVFKNYSIDGKRTVFSCTANFAAASKHRGGILLGGGKIEITPFEIAIENYTDKEQGNIKYSSNLPTTSTDNEIRLLIDATNSPSSNPYLTLWVNNVMIFERVQMLSYDDRNAGIVTEAINSIGLYSTHQGDSTFSNMTLTDMSNTSSQQAVTPEMNYSSWTTIGKTSNKIIDISGNKIKITSKPAYPSYLYLEYLPVDISRKMIQLDYTCYYGASSMWGGFLYRGRLIDVNPNRIGIRTHSLASLPQSNSDGVQETPEIGGISPYVAHNIRATIDGTLDKPVLSLWVDGVQKIDSEEIQSVSSTDTSFGFASDYSSSSYVTVTNVQLQNIVSGIYGDVHSYYNKVVPQGTMDNQYAVLTCGVPQIKDEIYLYNVKSQGIVNYKGSEINSLQNAQISVDYTKNPAIIKIKEQ